MTIDKKYYFVKLGNETLNEALGYVLPVEPYLGGDQFHSFHRSRKDAEKEIQHMRDTGDISHNARPKIIELSLKELE